MATYVIGDIQGCYKSFQALLKQICFKANKDRLLLLGDLVNRGPRSLEVLDFVFDNQKSINSVLGNHDLYLISLFLGAVKLKKQNLSLEKILQHKKAADLIFWLRKRPLLLLEDNFALVHAGIYPDWSIREAKNYAKEAQKIIRENNAHKYLKYWLDCDGEWWSPHLDNKYKIAAILNIFTRMRFLTHGGSLDFDNTDKPSTSEHTLIPWFKLRSVRSPSKYKIIFGHWAALGLFTDNKFACLDSGCVWGNFLTAMRLQDGAIFTQNNID